MSKSVLKACLVNLISKDTPSILYLFSYWYILSLPRGAICDRGIFGHTHFGWSTVMNQSGRYYDTFTFVDTITYSYVTVFLPNTIYKILLSISDASKIISNYTNWSQKWLLLWHFCVLYTDLDFNTWQDQSNAEARALVEVVQGDNHAIVMGDINSSPDLPASDVQHNMEGE